MYLEEGLDNDEVFEGEDSGGAIDGDEFVVVEDGAGRGLEVILVTLRIVHHGHLQ